MKILNHFFTKCNSIETPFNDSDHLVSIDSKYHDINDFNKLNINKNPSFATLHLKIALLPKHFEDFQNSLSLLKHSFNIIGILEHKINKGLENSTFKGGRNGVLLNLTTQFTNCHQTSSSLNTGG